MSDHDGVERVITMPWRAQTGQSVPVIEHVSAYNANAGLGGQAGSAQVAWSDDGTAVYLARQDVADEASVQWMDRTGTVTPLRAARADWADSQFSPAAATVVGGVAQG